ncbi:VIT domain-containing protein [Sorangium sp. So ce260]|uniref:VIT domain-containing protein n=1 Tax=Sorangium sp. So ce260 TaxID=3133291 RepID=UPI003F5DB9AC
MKRALAFLLPLVTAACGPAADPALATANRPPPTASPVRLDWAARPGEDADPTLGPPVSLTTPDGTRLSVVALDARVVIEDPLAFTELRYRFKNPGAQLVEGRFETVLPAGAAVSRFAMRIRGQMQEGEVVEATRATQVYEAFLHEQVDPALLEKQPGNRFQARVFPIFPGEVKEIILSYSQELARADEPYRLRVRGLPRLDAFDLRVFLGTGAAPGTATSPGAASPALQAFGLYERGFLPDRDVVLPLVRPGERHGRALRFGSRVVARVTPVLDDRQAPAPMKGLLVLVDTSASRAFGFGAQVRWLGSLLDAIRQRAGPGAALRVACFDQGVAEVYRGDLAGFGPRALGAIEARRPLGASDLEKALRYAAQAVAQEAKTYDRVLLLSDGIASAGAVASSALAAGAARLSGSGIERLDAIALGESRDAAQLGGLASSLPSAGVVQEGAPPPSSAAARLMTAALAGISVRVPGAKWVWPSTIRAAVQPGDQVLVHAEVEEGRPFEIVLGGGASAPRAVPLAAASSELLVDRAIAHARILDLEERHRGASTASEREDLRRQIVQLSTSRRVLSRFTTLLVLETESDYDRFRIDRRALVDILEVGPTGLELVNRRDGRVAPAGGPGSGTGLSHLGGSPIPGERTPFPDVPDVPDAAEPLPARPPDIVRVTETDVRFLRQVYFEANSARIKAEFFPFLDEVARTLAQYPQLTRIEILGHADDREAASVRVSQARAEAVRRYLVEQGVEPERLVARGHGSAMPLLENKTEQYRARNRRVELLVQGMSRPAGPVARSLRALWSAPTAPAHTGRFAETMASIQRGPAEAALREAQAWRDAEPTDALALIALGQALEEAGQIAEAERAYGSLIDLYPGRAELRRAAGAYLERLADRSQSALPLAIDTYRRALELRPDHPSSHRLLAFALARHGSLEAAFSVLEGATRRAFDAARFPGVDVALKDDLGLLAAAWIKAQPARAAEIEGRAAAAGAQPSRGRSVRFALTWENDANDVDLDIAEDDGSTPQDRFLRKPARIERWTHASSGHGPEVIVIADPPAGYRYRVQARYQRRGAMGHALGKVQIIGHDGSGALRFDDRPFVLMNEGGGVDLGVVAE